MILLGLISWPYLRRHLVRSLLTLTGIAIGVAVFVAMHAANDSVFRAFRRTVDRIAGATELEVSAGEAGFSEEVLERVQALAEVRVAVPVIEAVAGTGLQTVGNLLILGVDMTGDRSLREYDLESGEEAIIDDPLVFLAQPDSIMVTREFAARTGATLGTRLPLETAVGRKWFVVRGVMRSGGLTSAFGGNLAVMDIYAAQHVFGRGRRIDRIDLAVAEGATPAATRDAVRRALGPGYTVEPPSARAEQFESVLAVYSLSMGVSSVFALCIGMFIIYNAFAVAVTQRRSEIGILRALGATRGQIRTIFLVESALGGLAGASVGVIAGLGLARSMAAFITELLRGVFGIAERAGDIEAGPGLIAIAVAMGVATSMIAAWLPARNAARVDPVQALQKGKYQVLTAGENRVRRRAALACAIVSAALHVGGGWGVSLYAAYFLTILGALLLAPSVALWLARALRPPFKALRPVEGALAADSLIQAPRRTSGAVAALMLSVAQVIGLAGISRASYESIADWVGTALNPDLFITASENLSDRTYAFPASLGDRLEQMDGVDDVQRVRSVRLDQRGVPALIVAVELESVGRRVPRRVVAGDETTMFREAAAGRGVIVSENFVQLRDFRLGDVVEIPSPGGMIRAPILGITVDWSDQQGTILMDRSLFRRYWQDDSVNIFRVYVEPGADVAAVRQRVIERFGSMHRLFVLTNESVRQYIMRLTDQWLALTYVQVLVAVLVAVLGIVNTLTVSIIDRRRELGVLQAVGGLRRQIRQTVWMEAAAIALIGSSLGVALGAINLFYLLAITARDLSGFRLEYQFPFEVVLILLPAIVAAGFLAAIWPAEAAVRGSLVEALEYE